MAKPSVLLAIPHKTLQPKLQYFYNMGIAGPDLTHIISINPDILARSLNNTIIPSVNYLTSLVGTDDKVAIILNKSVWVHQAAERILGPNNAILQGHGVPQCNIAKVFMSCPQSLYKSTDLIKEKVLQLVRMGFCPSSLMFLQGLHVLVGMNKPKCDEKIAVYKSFGWSENEVLSMFKMQPCIMSASVKRVTLLLSFFLNDLKWTPQDIARVPFFMTYSLEKRIIPRCRVLQILQSKNLITKAGVLSALKFSDDRFLKQYVSKYHYVEPNLMKMYQLKMSTTGLRAASKS